MDADFTPWRRAILMVIGVLIVAAVVGGVYAWYELHLLNSVTTNIPTSETQTSLQKQQNVIKSMTAPTTVSAPATSSSPKASSSLNAPAQKTTKTSTNTTAQDSQEQAVINSLTAPSK